jgi:hypothetical protein
MANKGQKQVIASSGILGFIIFSLFFFLFSRIEPYGMLLPAVKPEILNTEHIRHTKGCFQRSVARHSNTLKDAEKHILCLVRRIHDSRKE